MKSKISRAQKYKIQELQSVTGAPEEYAYFLLEENDWDIAIAVDAFFDQPMPTSTSLPRQKVMDATKLNSWFDRYADEEDPDVILDEGIERFCTDIGVDTQDIAILIISWQMKAATMCCFTREEWATGMNALGCEDLETMVSKMDTVRGLLLNRSDFRDFYVYCFHFSKEEGQKSLAIDTALAMWQIVLLPRFAKMKDWCDFIKATEQTHSVTLDTWSLVFDFMVQVDAGYEQYDENGAWPVLIDDFMEWRSQTQ